MLPVLTDEDRQFPPRCLYGVTCGRDTDVGARHLKVHTGFDLIAPLRGLAEKDLSLVEGDLISQWLQFMLDQQAMLNVFGDPVKCS